MCSNSTFLGEEAVFNESLRIIEEIAHDIGEVGWVGEARENQKWWVTSHSNSEDIFWKNIVETSFHVSVVELEVL